MSNYRKLCTAALIGSFGESMIMPFFIIFLHQLAGGRLFEASIFLAIFAAGSSILAPIFGWISDKTGRRGWIILGSFGGATIFYLLARVTHINQMYVLCVFMALTSAMASPLGALEQDITEGKKQGSLLNIINIIIRISAAAGVFLGARFIEQYGFPLVFLLTAVFVIISTIPFFFFKKGDAT